MKGGAKAVSPQGRGDDVALGQREGMELLLFDAIHGVQGRCNRKTMYFDQQC
jgi:hypothetical protein